jgi:hypothetical protein
LNPLLKRILEFVDRHGEPFTVSGSNKKGVFSNATYAQLRNYIPDAELSLLSPPYWILFVAGNDSTNLDDTVTWNGTTYPVRGLMTARWRAAVVAKLLVLGSPGIVEF